MLIDLTVVLAGVLAPPVPMPQLTPVEPPPVPIPLVAPAVPGPVPMPELIVPLGPDPSWRAELRLEHHRRAGGDIGP